MTNENTNFNRAKFYQSLQAQLDMLAECYETLTKELSDEIKTKEVTMSIADIKFRNDRLKKELDKINNAIAKLIKSEQIIYNQLDMILNTKENDVV